MTSNFEYFFKKTDALYPTESMKIKLAEDVR